MSNSRCNSVRARLSLSVCAIAMTATAGSALAQEAEAQFGSGEIIVTAQRRAESVQEVPIAVSVLSGDELLSSGATDTFSLAGKVPTLSIQESGSTLYFLRGVGTTGSSINSEQSVATYVDGVYVYSTWSSSVPLGSIQRVEVLKGPQGTLFGRNTTGGVIQVVTRDPLDDAAIEGSVGYGNYETITASFYGSTRLGDNAGISLAVDFRDQGEGYGYNSTRDEDIFWRDKLAIQAKAAWEVTPTTKLTGYFWYDKGKNSGQYNQPYEGTRFLDGVDYDYDFYENRSNTENSLDFDSYLGYVRLDQELGDFADFVSITSYRRIDSLYKLDQDQTPATIVDATLDIPFRNFSQEFQLQSASDGPLTWLLGAYYFWSSAKYNPLTLEGAAAAAAGGQIRFFREQVTKSYAGFAQVSYNLTPETTLTGGIRYTDEKQTMPEGKFTLLGPDPAPTELPFLPDEQDSSGWSWRLALDHQFTPDVMAYVSWNHSLKSGGFPLVTTGNLPGYAPEKLDAYELGLKTEFLNGRVRINAAAFLYKFKDIQVTRVTTGGNVVANAAEATMKGIDIDLDISPTPYFNVYAAFGYLDGKYDDYQTAVYYIPRQPAPAGGAATLADQDASGNRTIFSPEMSATVGASYAVPTSIGKFKLDSFLLFVDKQYVGPSNAFIMPSYSLLNAGLGWTSDDEHFYARVWANNLLDKEYFAHVYESTTGINTIAGTPQTYGVTLGFKY